MDYAPLVPEANGMDVDGVNREIAYRVDKGTPLMVSHYVMAGRNMPRPAGCWWYAFAPTRGVVEGYGPFKTSGKAVDYLTENGLDGFVCALDQKAIEDEYKLTVHLVEPA